MLRELITHFDEFRRNFRIVDALDISVIAVLLYAGLIWFRQTASRSVVIGATVLTALYLLARSFDMFLTSLVFQTAFAVLLVALVVLFQEEIRRALEGVAGWGQISKLRPKTEALYDDVDSLVEAAFAMARRKIGALIVLRGREPLDRHIDGGIELSGLISKPILYSIFDPASAGHDGAAIIEHSRIAKFGAHLPISKNQKVIKGRGTRHAAALGLAECSDALTIVVSEERGVVSVALRSSLVEVETAADLKSRIEQFLSDRFPQKSQAPWKRFVTRDVGGKLLALSLAIAAWFVLAYNVEEVQTTVVVPIEYRNPPQHVQIDESTPVEALVTLSGSERDFRLMDRQFLKISIDLSLLNAETDTIPITANDVRLPPNLEVDRILPSEIRLRFKAPPEPEE